MTNTTKGAAPTQCSRCNGSGVVEDGEIDCYPDGTPFTSGPIKRVKDCPKCKGEALPADALMRLLALANEELFKAAKPGEVAFDVPEWAVLVGELAAAHPPAAAPAGLQQQTNTATLSAEQRASLRHFLSAALIFPTDRPLGEADTKDRVYERTLAAFDEWFALSDGAIQRDNK